MAPIRLLSAGDARPHFLRRRLRFLDFPSSRCPPPDLKNIIFPVAVFLNRFAADFLVFFFILGMMHPLLPGTGKLDLIPECLSQSLSFSAGIMTRWAAGSPPALPAPVRVALAPPGLPPPGLAPPGLAPPGLA